MGPTGYSETSVRNYHYLLHNNTEGHSSQTAVSYQLSLLPKYNIRIFP